MNPEEGSGPPLQPPPVSRPSLVIAVLVDNFQMALLKGLEKVKQEVVREWGRGTNQEDTGRGTHKLGGRKEGAPGMGRHGTLAELRPLLRRRPPRSMRSYWMTH